MISPERQSEVLNGLQQYRSELLANFAYEKGVVKDIRKVLASEGVKSSTPLALVPYTLEKLQTADAIAGSSVWQEPNTVRRIRYAVERRKDLDSIGSVYKAGSPKPFYECVIDLMVGFDDRRINSSRFGPICSKSLFIDQTAHEITHSAFSQLTSTELEETEDDKVKLIVARGISQAKEEIILFPGGGEVKEYNPMWLDEAFSNHMAAKVREVIHPEGVPQKSGFYKDIWLNKAYEVDEIFIPNRYLIYSEIFPDKPVTLGGSISAIGLDELSEKRPSIMPQIKALAAGGLSVVEFHRNLKNGVGGELYSAMTERRPYNTWGAVLEQIRDLS